MNKYIKNTGYFFVGINVIVAYKVKDMVENCIDIGQRAMCEVPLHSHHYVCPECDMPA